MGSAGGGQTPPFADLVELKSLRSGSQIRQSSARDFRAMRIFE
jgi:hypothetical protein